MPKRSRSDFVSEEELPNRKKQKINNNNNSTTLENSDKVIEPEHKRGSIYRVALHNFVTYNDCEFFPGPLLNVVIGPNGSGKSSIVCGLVLGLGGPPKLLGRAKQLKEFIRHGSHEAWIELELYKLCKNGRNATIKRILKQDNSSTWEINGKLSTKVEVKKLIESANIQIDNVCQFLPQDKVVEFAKLDQYQLLKETEKAVGPKEMINYHLNLIEMYSNQSQSKMKLETQIKHLNDLKIKNEALERDVLRFREREKLLKKVNLMKKKRPWIEYRNITKELTTAKENFLKAKEELKNQEKKSEPLKNEIQQLKEKLDSMEGSRTTRQTALKTLDSKRKTCMHQLNEIDNKLQSSFTSIEKLKTRHNDRMKLAEQTEQQINSIKSQINSIDISNKDELLKNIQEQFNAEKLKEQHIRDKLFNLQYSSEQKKDKCRTIEHELQTLSNAQRRRLDELRTRNKDTHNALSWINEKASKGEFKDKVYGPILLEVTVTDSYHAKCFESQTPNWLLDAFVTQNEHDYEYIMNNLYTRQKLKINVTSTHRITGDFLDHPDSIENIKHFGIKGWLSDFVDGPDTVKLILRCNANIQTAAIGSESTSPSQLFQNSPTLKLFKPDSVYSTKRSMYGNRNSSTVVYPLYPARLIKGVDTQKIERLQSEIIEVKQSIQQDETEKRQLEQQLRIINENLTNLQQQKENIIRKERQKKDLSRKLVEKNRQLSELLQEEDTSKKEEQYKQTVKKYLLKQEEIGSTMKTVLQKLTELALKVDYYILSRSGIMNELSLKNRLLSEIQEAFASLRNVVRNTGDEYERLKSLTNRAKLTAQKKAPMTEELHEVFQSFPDDIEALDIAIVEAETRANLNYRANPHLIEDYEKRKAEIKVIEEQIDDMTLNGDKLQQKIEKTKEKWLVPLKLLIKDIRKSFKKYFRNIGCYGRVELAEDEDFSKYGIVIHVSFRPDQDPQILDAFTQSGGERSVTTMLYLVSLQDLTDCPFRLVDEINQGMDPTNERMIFEEVTKSACNPSQPQFFLITPKLLPGLVFTPEMTVLCVMNGPWMIPQETWDTLQIHSK